MSEKSPFAKQSTFCREQTFCEKLSDNISERVDDFYLDLIPSEDIKSMEPRYMYPLGGLILLVLVGIFAGVFIPSYLSQINAKFLVPAGTGDTKYCDTVTISNTGTFLATQQGSWIGSEGFSYSEAAYSLSITNLEMDQEAYESSMNDLYKSLVYVGQIAKVNDLGINLLFWMTMTLVDDINAQRFNMASSPLIIFNRQRTFGTISNMYGDCNANAVSSFDQANGLMSVEYNYLEFMSNPTCNTTVTPANVGYTTWANAQLFTISFDIRTLITGLAVNLNIVDLASMQEIIPDRGSFLYKGVNYTTSSYTNPQFPGMAPITCIIYDDTPHCVLPAGDVYALPIYNHSGANFSLPEICNCSVLTVEELADQYNLCNVFTFISGFIFWDTFLANPLFELSLKYSFYEINLFAFYPSFIGSAWGRNSVYYDTLLNTPEYRQKAYAFCDTPDYGTCSVVGFSSFDTTITNWAVSSYYFSLKDGCCTDSFSTSPENWNALVSTPFSPLTQQYEECRNDPFTVLSNQAGVAMGNVSLLSPFGVLFVLLLILCYQQVTGNVIPKTFSKSEKDSALDALAVALLLARDERLKPKLDRQNLCEMVTKLVDELAVLSESSEAVQYKSDPQESMLNVDWHEVMKSTTGYSSSKIRQKQQRSKSRAAAGAGANNSNNSMMYNSNSSSVGRSESVSSVGGGGGVEMNTLLSSNGGGGGGVHNPMRRTVNNGEVTSTKNNTPPNHTNTNSNNNNTNDATNININFNTEYNTPHTTTNTTTTINSTFDDTTSLIILNTATTTSTTKQGSEVSRGVDLMTQYNDTLKSIDDLTEGFKLVSETSHTNNNTILTTNNENDADLSQLISKTSILLTNTNDILNALTTLTHKIESERLNGVEQHEVVDSDDDEHEGEHVERSVEAGNLKSAARTGINKPRDDPRTLLHTLFHKIYSLLVLHTSVVMNCDITLVVVRYGDRAAYVLNNGEILSVNELRKRVESYVM